MRRTISRPMVAVGLSLAMSLVGCRLMNRTGGSPVNELSPSRGGEARATYLGTVTGGQLTTKSSDKSAWLAEIRDQIARILDGMDIPRRDEFDAVKAMAARAREENEELRKQVAELQARLQQQQQPS